MGDGSPPLNLDLRIKTLTLEQRTLSWLLISLAVLPIHPQLSFQEPSNPWLLVATQVHVVYSRLGNNAITAQW